MPLNRFFTHHTIYVNGQYFDAGRWTDAWESPELIEKVRSGILRSAKAIEQVENYISPPMVTIHITPQIPIVQPNPAFTQAVASPVHPAFAAPAQAVITDPVKAEILVDIPVELPIVEAVDASKLNRKSPKGK